MKAVSQPQLWQNSSITKISVKQSKLTTEIWTVNSTPIPAVMIRITAGIALSFISHNPINPNNWTIITVNTTTCKQKQKSSIQLSML